MPVQGPGRQRVKPPAPQLPAAPSPPETPRWLLGGGSNGYSIAELVPLTVKLNRSFAGGVSTFAQDRLVNGSCP